MYHVPSAVVRLLKTNPAPVLVTVIFAPGTTDPVLSMTAPTMVAVPVDDCATRLTATRASESRRRRNMGGLSFWGMLSRERVIVNPVQGFSAKDRAFRATLATDTPSPVHPLSLEERRPDPGAPRVHRTRIHAVEPDYSWIGWVRGHAVVIAPTIASAAVQSGVMRDAGF